MKTLKELKKEADERLRASVPQRDGEGRAVVELTVRRDEDFLSDYSVEKPEISSAVADFLQEQTSALRPKDPILLRIYSDCIDEEEKGTYEGALREHALRRYHGASSGMKRNAAIAAVMFAIGVLGLVATVLCNLFADNPVFSEVLDIFAWVFVWEAVDLFFLQRASLRAERTRALRLYDAKVEYHPLAAEENK